MALRRSKKKLPAREDKMMKEKSKIEEGVFDRAVFMIFYGLLNKGIISSLDYPIATGKESDVYRATSGKRFEDQSQYMAAKIFRIETANFIHMQDYLFADPRFSHVRRTKREVIFAWCQKEFKNLQICAQANVPAPKPFFFSKSVLLMEFIGEEGIPDSTLKAVGSEDPEKDCETILGYIRRLYRAGLVHADLSEFNILMHGYPNPVPYLIDCGQGVVLGHPKAKEFLERDIRNVLRYFKHYGVKRDATEILEWVKK